MSAPFDAHSLRDRLARFPVALKALASTASATDARWKPAPGHWSILETCCHLLDEEREDFRVRIELTLSDPPAAWPRLDLEGIAERRRYNEQDLEATLAEFALARAANLAWLDSVRPYADFTRAYVHPKFGPLGGARRTARPPGLPPPSRPRHPRCRTVRSRLRRRMVRRRRRCGASPARAQPFQ